MKAGPAPALLEPEAGNPSHGNVAAWLTRPLQPSSSSLPTGLKRSTPASSGGRVPRTRSTKWTTPAMARESSCRAGHSLHHNELLGGCFLHLLLLRRLFTSGLAPEAIWMTGADRAKRNTGVGIARMSRRVSLRPTRPAC